MLSDQLLCLPVTLETAASAKVPGGVLETLLMVLVVDCRAWHREPDQCTHGVASCKTLSSPLKQMLSVCDPDSSLPLLFGLKVKVHLVTISRWAGASLQSHAAVI